MDINERDKARFWIKVKQTNRCWEWTASLNNTGYGVFNLKGETLAHRIAYQIFYGKIGDKQVLHKCDNTKCVNPDHLFVGNHDDNMKDKQKKGRSRMFGRSSQYLGVSWRNDSNRWRSYIIINKKSIHLACHTNEIDAAKNYDRVAFTEYGITDRLNFPKDWMPLPLPPNQETEVFVMKLDET